jgi:hypothetical protein
MTGAFLKASFINQKISNIFTMKPEHLLLRVLLLLTFVICVVSSKSVFAAETLSRENLSKVSVKENPSQVINPVMNNNDNISSEKTPQTNQTNASTLQIKQPDAPLPEPLYEAKILAPAPTDGFDDQPKLLQQAFKDMLIRLSGSEKIINHATVVKALSEVDNYVKQFSFQINDKQERMLSVRFDDFQCRELMKHAGQPILGAKRPPVVLWLAMQKDNVTQWVSVDMQNELSQELANLADKRGLTLVYPLLDLTDTSLVTEQQVWNEDITALQAASKRYNANHLLIGKLNKQPSGWYAQWTYVKEGNSIRWDMSNTELAAVFGDALDEFSNHLAIPEANLAKSGSNDSSKVGTTGKTENGVTPALKAEQLAQSQSNGFAEQTGSNQSKTLRLAIVGVVGSEQYVKVLKYLKSLPAVKDVEVAEITPEQTIFNLDTTATREAIIDSIAAGQLLTDNSTGMQTSLPVESEAAKESLNYKLIGLQ